MKKIKQHGWEFILSVKRADDVDFEPSSLRRFSSSVLKDGKLANFPPTISTTENLTKQGNLWKFKENNLKIEGKKKKKNNEEIKILY